MAPEVTAKAIEPLTATQTTADGDVGDLGMDAAQMFGLAGPPPGQEGEDDDEEDSKPPPKKRAARKPRQAAKATAATAEGAAEEGKDAGKEPAVEPQAGVSFRKEGSKRKPKKAGPASAAADSSQVGLQALQYWFLYFHLSFQDSSVEMTSM